MLKIEMIHIVCAADNNYSMQLAVAMRSALENLVGQAEISLHIIDGGISEFSKRKILKSLITTKKYEVNFIEIPSNLLDLIKDSHASDSSLEKKANYVSVASFYRLLIPELIPNYIDKVIYLDCDLVVEGNLLKLWEIDIGDNYILAAQDTWIPCISSPNARLDYNLLGLPPSAKYFNAGVLVINLKKWRHEKISFKAMEYFKANSEHIGWYDQGLLNILFVNNWRRLEPKWNCNPTSYYDHNSRRYFSWEDTDKLFSESTYNELIANPSIIHYVSEKKPWTSRHTPRKEIFFNYLDKTLWKGWRLNIWKRILYRLRYEITVIRKRYSN